MLRGTPSAPLSTFDQRSAFADAILLENHVQPVDLVDAAKRLPRTRPLSRRDDLELVPLASKCSITTRDRIAWPSFPVTP